MGQSSQSGQIVLRSQAVAGVFQADLPTLGVKMFTKSGSLGTNRELMIPDPEIGGGRDVVDASLGPVVWSGEYEFYVRMDSFLTLLKAALGQNAIVTTTGVSTHTTTPVDGTLLLLSIQEAIGSSFDVFEYTDCVVNTLHVESDANGYLSGTVGLIAIKQIAGGTRAPTPVPDVAPLIVGTNIVVTYNAVSLPAKSFSLDINNNFEDDDFRLGSFYIGDLTPKRRVVTASFGIREGTSGFWRQATYGTSASTQAGGITTKSQLVITATSYEDIPAGTPATKYSMAVTIPKFALSPYSIQASGDDVIESDIEGTALRPVFATPLLTSVIKSGLATVA
jgi:Phage tail tube protein